jgi:hypothetical protein
MAKTETALFQEIFDSSSVIDSVAPVIHQKPAPLRIDDPLWEHITVTSGKIPNRIENDEFIKTVSGYDLAPQVSNSTATESIEMRSAGLRLLELAKRNNLAHREAIARRAPERKRQIEQIFETALQPIARRNVRGYDGWGALIESAERYTADSILESI